MGFLNGSASFVRFSVEGELPENFWDFVAERIMAFSFKDIDDTTTILRQLGLRPEYV